MIFGDQNFEISKLEQGLQNNQNGPGLWYVEEDEDGMRSGLK